MLEIPGTAIDINASSLVVLRAYNVQSLKPISYSKRGRMYFERREIDMKLG